MDDLFAKIRVSIENRIKVRMFSILNRNYNGLMGSMFLVQGSIPNS